jgi:transcriptional regulator with PAS, ATPase and Fis domain
MESAMMVGVSPAIESIRVDIAQAARCDAKVLITGESGAGKEIVAQLIHATSRRNRSPLVTVNCAALTETLLETELFGHVRGSFTGAYRDRAGAFELADRGTVFLDEVGEMTPRMQGLLLRFLETGEIQRVGSDRRQTRVDVRIIAATNRVLLESVAEKKFREDLYYRLNVIHLSVPPLRDRPDDIPLLFDHFLKQFSHQYHTPAPVLTEDVREMLLRHSWPGNVRELRNMAERLVVHPPHKAIGMADIRMHSASTKPPADDERPARPSSVDEKWVALTTGHESFWSVVYAPFMSRDLTRDDVRTLVRMGLENTAGNYKILVELFNMRPDDYKRFLGFLRKYHCHIPFQQFRCAEVSSVARSTATRPPARIPVSAA